MQKSGIPEIVTSSVLVLGDTVPDAPHVKGNDFSTGIDLDSILEGFRYCGFQATNIALAIDEVNRMINWRLSDEPIAEGESDYYKDEEVRKKTKCTIFFGYTSNMISCGIRETIRFLVQNKMVDCIVTTAGGIEEDLMKCMAPTFMGDFSLQGKELRLKGINRIGNLLVPNANYCKLEKWMMPILDDMLKEQKEKGIYWSPSKMIARFGKEIDNPESVYYWAQKNDIPVFCPAITDGSVGDMIYFHSYTNPGLVVDIAQDIREINNLAAHAKKTGMIILGGGMVKHHINNANLMRNGADFAVLVNTGQEFDGSDSGARPDEAVSWGKIRLEAKPVKVYAEASIVFPLIVAGSFAKKYHENKN